MPIINERRWEFDKIVEPGEELLVTFTLKAVEKPGRYQGNVDVFTSGSANFTRMHADTIVKSND